MLVNMHHFADIMTYSNYNAMREFISRNGVKIHHRPSPDSGAYYNLAHFDLEEAIALFSKGAKDKRSHSIRANKYRLDALLKVKETINA